MEYMEKRIDKELERIRKGNMERDRKIRQITEELSGVKKELSGVKSDVIDLKRMFDRIAERIGKK